MHGARSFIVITNHSDPRYMLFYIDGQRYQRYSRDVDNIVYIGMGGDDYFENRTSIPSTAYGELEMMC